MSLFKSRPKSGTVAIKNGCEIVYGTDQELLQALFLVLDRKGIVNFKEVADAVLEGIELKKGCDCKNDS